MPRSKLVIWRMVIHLYPLVIGNPYIGYINPHYWVDDHPLLYGNDGSLDLSTYIQENYNTPLEHTQSAIPGSPTMKGIPAYSLLVKVARGVFQRCVETTLEYIDMFLLEVEVILYVHIIQ